ncbi:hypothetical protein BTK_31756 (plasmid) [Bacillus thuringiensis serovar kurstaki str. HD-1]|nr:hypothetical protein BTK_31756 [Bacillus thuringiensis serovar kurstaki str. HD-1]
MLAKMKSWLKNEDSQLSSENGMLIALAVIIVLVISGDYRISNWPVCMESNPRWL